MKIEKMNFSVLIPDGESPLLFNLLNCFSQVKGVDVYVMSNLEHSSFKVSSRIKKYIYNPKTNTETDWVSNINKEVSRFNIDVVLPIDENGIRILIKHKNLIPNNKLVALASYENFNIAINKGVLTAYMNKTQIQKSNNVVVKPGGLFDDEKIKFPVLIKPTVNSGGGVGITKFYSREELEKYFINNKFEIDYLVEEYLSGYNICCNVFCIEGTILASTIHKGLMKGNREFGPSVGLEFLYEDDLYQIIKTLMKSLNWSGVANIDLIYEEIAKEFRVIEINPRVWYNVEASALAGVNFPYLQCLHHLSIDFEKPKYNFVKYLNLNGVLKCIKSNKFSMLSFKVLFKNGQLPFVLKDPLPMVYQVFSKLKKR
jgi:D-aspartate ligase